MLKKYKIELKDYFICKEKECGKLFYNDDDNVCVYCGSKNTEKIYKIKLRGEVVDLEN